MNNLQIGVKILIIDEINLKFIALKRTHNTNRLSFNEAFDIPGGRILFGEEPLEALKREIYEEIGLTLQNKPILIHAANIFLDQLTQIVRLTYMVNEKVNLKNLALSCEHSHVEFLALKQNDLFHPILNEAINECLNKFNS